MALTVVREGPPVPCSSPWPGDPLARPRSALARRRFSYARFVWRTSLFDDIGSGGSALFFTQQCVQQKGARHGGGHRGARGSTPGRAVCGPADGEASSSRPWARGSCRGARSRGGGFSLVEHPIAPAHPARRYTHAREDEYSFVSRAAWARNSATTSSFAERRRFRLQAARAVAHVLERGDKPCRILEIISPGGFEQFFAELGSGGSPPEAGARTASSSTSRASRACANSTG